MIDWKEYENRKRSLPDNLTSEEYEEAIKRIVDSMEKPKKKKPKVMNDEIKKYPIYMLNTSGQLIQVNNIKSTNDYNHNQFALHHYIPYQSYIKNQKWYEENGINQKLILMSHICHEHIHNIGIKTLSDEEFESKYKISKWKLIYNTKHSETERSSK